MNCGQAREQTYYYVDGELPAEQARDFDAHVEACADCRQLVEALQHEAELLTSYFEAARADRPERSRRLRANVLAALELGGTGTVTAGTAVVESHATTLAWPPWLRWAALAAAATLVVVAIALAIRALSPSGPPKAPSPTSMPAVVQETTKQDTPEPPQVQPTPADGGVNRSDGGTEPETPVGAEEESGRAVPGDVRPTPRRPGADTPRPRGNAAPVPEPAPRVLPPAYGRLAAVTGNARVRVVDAESWRPAAPEQPLRPGDTILTGEAGGALAEFDDGSSLDCGADTELALGDKAEGVAGPAGASLWAGRLLASVDGAHGRQFDVETPVATATVTGTQFLLSATDERAVVLVREGAVDFWNEFGRVSVREGERSECLRGQAPSTPRRVAAARWFGAPWRAAEDPREATAPQPAVKGPNLPPHVVDCDPKPFATNVDPDLKGITVTFDRPMAPTAQPRFGPFAFAGAFPAAKDAVPRWDETGTVCSLPVELVADAMYSLSLNSVDPDHLFTDLAGLPAVTFAWMFATEERASPDFPAHVIASDPPQAATDVDPGLRQISVTFDRPLIAPGPSAAMPLAQCAAYPAGSAKAVLGEDRQTVTVDVRLTPDTAYAIGFSAVQTAQLRDLLSRPVLPFFLCFHTASATEVTVRPTPPPGE